MSLNTHPTKSDHHNHHHDNLLFSTEEMRQVDKSVAHNKLLKVIASLVIVIAVTNCFEHLHTNILSKSVPTTFYRNLRNAFVRNDIDCAKNVIPFPAERNNVRQLLS